MLFLFHEYHKFRLFQEIASDISGTAQLRMLTLQRLYNDLRIYPYGDNGRVQSQATLVLKYQLPKDCFFGIISKLSGSLPTNNQSLWYRVI